MRVIIAGSSGLIGTALRRRLEADGHMVTPLLRPQSAMGISQPTTAVHWNPERGEIDLGSAAPSDAVINLAGENLAAHLWTSSFKQRILESRVASTRLLGQAVAQLSVPPKVFINASAVGYYGNTGARLVAENCPPGDGFLSKVCVEWERAAIQSVPQSRTRLVIGRFGIVLAGDGGALSKMLLPFRLGLGGKIGGGRQFLSWIAVDDAIDAILHCVTTSSIEGPVNVVSPHSVTNEAFSRTLARQLRRPAFTTVPAGTLRLLLRDMADETLLSSTRAVPERLSSTGFSWRYHELKSALEHLLGT